MTKEELFPEMLFDAIKSTIEEMGFLEVEHAPHHVDISTLECVSIQVVKPFLGRFYFFFAPELKYEVVRNLYAKEVVAEKEAQDAVLELMNVITGRFLSQLTDNKDYEMEFPLWQYDHPKFYDLIADLSLLVTDYEVRVYAIKEEM